MLYCRNLDDSLAVELAVGNVNTESHKMVNNFPLVKGKEKFAAK